MNDIPPHIFTVWHEVDVSRRRWLLTCSCGTLRMPVDDAELPQLMAIHLSVANRCRSAVCYGVNWRTGGALHTRCRWESGHPTTHHVGPAEAGTGQDVSWALDDQRAYETDRDDHDAWEVAP